jgi:C-terminal processing protease CtpA/Prc
MRRPLRAAYLWLTLVPGCASVPDPPDAMPAHAVTARRVLSLLEQRHLRGQAPDAALLDRMAAGLSARLSCPKGIAHVQRERSRLDTDLREGEFTFLREAAQACGVRSSFDAEAQALDALAKAYDPHSAYLSPAQLATFREELDAAELYARGRIVEHAGRRAAWIVLPSFYLTRNGRSASGDVRYIVQQLAARAPSVLLLDLRSNSGGVIEEVLRLAGLLIGSGAVGYARTADGGTTPLRAAGDGQLWQGPLVIVVDAGTASVSEIFAAAVRDRGRGLIIGRRTHGKGTGQELVLLSSPLGAAAGAVRISDRFFYRLDGRTLQQKGVTPDVELPGSDPTSERERPDALVASDVAPFERISIAPLPAAVLETRSNAPDPDQRALEIALAYAGSV